MCLGLAKAHRLKPLAGAPLRQPVATFELETSHSWTHSALPLFVKEIVGKGFDLSLEFNGFIHCLLCVVVLVDL